ncbi:unnamed protein product [Prorocentrum cordatum]|uniref:Uncharacterized protein n=1 Tax=Prorocentrum cordatum TaxID=2364126 RepID=A0ABN9W4N3_9DINO|nr:unnamed protein product [Polarella glacialis]
MAMALISQARASPSFLGQSREQQSGEAATLDRAAVPVGQGLTTGATTGSTSQQPRPGVPSQVPPQLMTWAQAQTAAGPDGVPSTAAIGHLLDGTPLLTLEHQQMLLGPPPPPKEPPPELNPAAASSSHPPFQPTQWTATAAAASQSPSGVAVAGAGGAARPPMPARVSPGTASLKGKPVSSPPPQPRPDCNHSQPIGYGNQYGTGQKSVTRRDENETVNAEKPESAAEAARRAAASAERAMQVLPEDPGFKAGSAALQTVPEGLQALSKVREVIEQIVQYVSSAQSQNPGQVEEESQLTQQGITRIRRILKTLELMSDVLDHLTGQMSALTVPMTNVEQSVGQLTQMVVQIGAAVMSLVHVANQGSGTTQDLPTSQGGASLPTGEEPPGTMTTTSTKVPTAVQDEAPVEMLEDLDGKAPL